MNKTGDGGHPCLTPWVNSFRIFRYSITCVSSYNVFLIYIFWIIVIRWVGIPSLNIIVHNLSLSTESKAFLKSVNAIYVGMLNYLYIYTLRRDSTLFNRWYYFQTWLHCLSRYCSRYLAEKFSREQHCILHIINLWNLKIQYNFSYMSSVSEAFAVYVFCTEPFGAGIIFFLNFSTSCI